MLKNRTREDGPYRSRNTSTRNQVARGVWELVWLTLFRPTPRPFHAWRAFLLRLFGARLGRRCHIYAGARVWAPWNLVCGDGVGIANGVEIYNPATITVGDYAVVSQGAYLCGASHDMDDPAFPMVSAPIEIGDHAWICARASVQMGLRVGPGAVLAMGGIATRDLDAWSIYAGAPARKIRGRQQPEVWRQ